MDNFSDLFTAGFRICGIIPNNRGSVIAKVRKDLPDGDTSCEYLRQENFCENSGKVQKDLKEYEQS